LLLEKKGKKQTCLSEEDSGKNHHHNPSVLTFSINVYFFFVLHLFHDEANLFFIVVNER